MNLNLYCQIPKFYHHQKYASDHQDNYALFVHNCSQQPIQPLLFWTKKRQQLGGCCLSF
jgi:hypothetical protein